MKKVLIIVKKTIIRAFLILLLVFPIIFFLNTGLSIEIPWKVIQAIILAVVLTTIVIWPGLRKTFFRIALSLIIIMALLYTVSLLEWAEIIGSTGVGIITVSLLSYLPQMIKLGYIKKL